MFERFPDLRFGVTECGAFWVNDLLWRMDLVYERDHGQGWGNIAKRMGIKPGSAEFHRLKRGMVPTYDRWGRPIQLDAALERDFPGRGKGAAKHGGGPDRGHDDHGNGGKGKGNEGPGNSGKNKGNGNGNGNGNGGNGKGKGKD